MFEERGIPGIALVTEPFRQTGAAMAATWGLPGFKFAETPHPIAILDDVETGDRAQDLVSQVLALLRGKGIAGRAAQDTGGHDRPEDAARSRRSLTTPGARRSARDRPR
jgi:hypothetical protein